MKSGIYPKDSGVLEDPSFVFHESEPSKLCGIIHRYIRAKNGNFAFIRGLTKGNGPARERETTFRLPGILSSIIHSGEGMASKGYPGLVVVPPSDRWILKRRLFELAFLLLAVAWFASTSRVWVAAPDNNGDCQTDTKQSIASDFPEECGQSGESVTEAQPRPNKLTMGKASQSGSPVVSKRPTPAPVTGHLTKQHEADKKSIAKLHGPALRSSDRVKSPPPSDGSATSGATKKPASNPNPDARLAEQGDAFAQYRLGRFYAQHAGPQAPESVGWYVKASDGLRRLAEEGDGEAMYVLGVMYAFGRGVAKDREQARLWLAQAVDQQVPEAHIVLARLDGHRSADSR
jgi:uncharacterized protein